MIFNKEGVKLYVRIRKVADGFNEGGFRIPLIVNVTARTDIAEVGKQLKILIIWEDKFKEHEDILNDAEVRFNDPKIGRTVVGNSTYMYPFTGILSVKVNVKV